MSEHQPQSTNTIASALLTTKLALPRPRPSLVPREPLFTLLDNTLEHAITLLSAPAGFGKTTLARAWIASRNTQQNQFKVAWLSLDAGDNDPVRFWQYVIAACQHFATTIGQSALQWLSTAQPGLFEYSTRFPFEDIVTGLINDLNKLAEPCVLVMEDYHVIALSRIHEVFAYFLNHLPANIHVMLLSRSDPPLPLARLRAQGNILELRSTDLRFSLEESRVFFQQALSFPLAEETIAQVYERTEGWGAGLNLLAFALRRYPDRQEQERFVESLTGRYRPFLEYLVSDVLNTQPTPLQMFLLQTCGLTRLTASLCDAVTGRNDSDLLIEQIERANLFLEPLDGAGQWYRYHSLFSEAMLHEARHRFGTDAFNACFQRASIWYEQHSQLMNAVEAALKAEDFTRAAMLIERLSGSIYRLETREFYTLRRWFELIPLTVLEDYPALYLIYVAVLLFDPSGRVVTETEPIEKIETLLYAAEQQWSARGNTAQLGAIYTIRALLTTWQGDVKKAGSFARQALAYQGEEEETAWRSACLSIVGAEEHYFGSLDVALHIIQQSLELNRLAGGNPYGERAIRLELSEVYIEQGDLRLAAENYRQVIAEAGEDLFDRSKALLGLARLSYIEDRLDTATEAAQEALDLGQRLSDSEIHLRAALVLTCVLHARGNTEQARQQIAELVARAQVHASPLLYRELLYWQSRLHLMSGDLAVVLHWIQQRPADNDTLPLHILMQEDLLVARYRVMRGEMQDALQLLAQCLRKADQHACTANVIEIQVLMALAHFQQNNASEAFHILQEVLPLAHAKGYQRLFLDEGEAMVTLLRAFADNQHGQEAALPSPHPSPATLEILSTQERRVLRLFVVGLSKPEIASELVVSTNTIKTHLQRIYRKLNVKSRAEARAAVHRLQSAPGKITR